MTVRELPTVRPEILAPAGNAEMLRAAVFAGADAVYLGLQHFNARRTAGNFSAEELQSAVSFCHARRVRVYVALNTTAYPGELPALAGAVSDIAAAGADAVIVQDLAAASLVRRLAPGIALHGSTQMSVQSAHGVRQLAAMGFSRVILARELTLDEVAAVTRAAAECGVETEVFVHGALCMSVSGQCYMSAFLGGRSGNRGGCAGPCRLPFDAAGGARTAAGHHLSLKDLSALRLLPELARAGVASVKIEGRLRPPEYVAAAVDACLHARAAEPYDEELLQSVFSRSGFTNGYLEYRRGGGMFGTRTEADAAAARQAAPKLRELYRRESRNVGVSLALTLSADGARLEAADADGNRAVVSDASPLQPGQKTPEEARSVYRRALEKTGGTPFWAGAVSVTGSEWFLPGSAVNELRRRALEELLRQREAPRPVPCVPLPEDPAGLPAVLAGNTPRFAEGSGIQGTDKPCSGDHSERLETPLETAPEAASADTQAQDPAGVQQQRFTGTRQIAFPGVQKQGFAARFESPAQIPVQLPGSLRCLIVPLAAWREVPPALREKTWLELPRAVFGGAEQAAAREVQQSQKEGFVGYVAQNIAHFHTCAGLPVMGGFGLNVTNPLAAREYAALGACALTLSPELTLAALAECTARLAAPPLSGAADRAAECLTPAPVGSAGCAEEQNTPAPPGATNCAAGSHTPLSGTAAYTAGSYAPGGPAEDTAPLPTLAPAYGHMPLMLTRACPLHNVHSCAGCSRAGSLLDRKGMRFPVRCTGPDGARTVYNPIPLYWGDRRTALPVTMPLLYFTVETQRRAGEVLALFEAGRPFDGPFTRGLYEKGTS